MSMKIDSGMPNRISMNVSVGKQTQGATFGERVNAGLQQAGAAVASGAALVGEPGGLRVRLDDGLDGGRVDRGVV